MKRIVILAMLPALGGCVSLPHLPHFGLPKAQAAASSKPVCPGSVMADLQDEPKLPADAGFPKATTPEGGNAVNSYLTWLKAEHDWGKRGWQRVYDAKEFCSNSLK